MAITVGVHALENASTVVREEYETVGGRRTRAIRITGLVRGVGNLAALIDALDEIARAASEDSPVEVSLREGRRLFARREAFSREVNARALAGQFVLDMRADDAWEESATPSEYPWSIGFSGATLDVDNAGNAPAAPLIDIEAGDVLITPTIGDGLRELRYEGTVPAGSHLLIDCAAGRVLLDGLDMTPYTSGDFPMLVPGETVLTYTDDPGSSHFATAAVSFRARWW